MKDENCSIEFLFFVILLHNALYGFIEDERIREDLLSVDAFLI